MQSKARTVHEYLKALPPERREALEAVRKVVRKNLDPQFEEGIQYGMIGYYVPHSVYPEGYHCDPKQPLPFAGLASQKNHMSLYLMCLYGNPEEEASFRAAWARTGKKLDMGKSCVRFKRIEDLPLAVVGQAVKRVTAKKFISRYEENLGTPPRAPAREKAAAKRAAKPRAGTRKVAAKATKRKAAAKATARKK